MRQHKTSNRRNEIEWNSLFRPRADGQRDPLVMWNGNLRFAADGEGTVIDMLDVIGEDFWTGGGVRLKDVKSALSKATGAVTVNINSPGGDYMEGLAIYNALREYKGRVNVNVLGMAASAASLIAMGGDKVRCAKAGFLMIHNVWTGAVGDKAYFRKCADDMAKFDETAAEVYAGKCGKPCQDIAALMDAETWLSGDDAVELGLADDLLPSDCVKEDKAAMDASFSARDTLRFADVALARMGKTRSERRQMLKDLRGGTPGAADPKVMPGADKMAAVRDGLRRLVATLEGN